MTTTVVCLVMLGTKWNIHARNNIVFGNEYLSFENMILSDGYRNIEVNDINNNLGLSLDINNFNLDIIHGFIRYDKLKFAGTTSISAQVKNLFVKDKEISAYINIPDFTINTDTYGAVFIDVTKNPNDPLKANVSIGDFLAITGTYDEKAKFVDSRIKLRQAPMKIIEYLLKDGIKNTEGYIDADIAFGGPTSDLKIDGKGKINNGKTIN